MNTPPHPINEFVEWFRFKERKKRKHCIILVDQTKTTVATISTCGKTEVHIFVPVAFNLTLKRRVRNQSTYFTQSGLRQGVGFT